MSEYIIDFTDANFTIEPVEHNGEIVRCRDCNSYEQRKDGGYCHHFSMFDRAGWPVEPNGFCAWAERRTDE